MRKQKNQHGFSMAELLMVLPVLAAISWGIWTQVDQYTWSWKCHKDGDYANDIRVATNNFLAANVMILDNTKSIVDVRTQVSSGKWPEWKRAVPRIGDGTAAVQHDNYRYSRDSADTTIVFGTDTYDTCPDDHLCSEVSVANLRNWGFLPSTFADRSPLGYKYRIIIRKYKLNGVAGLVAYGATTDAFTKPTKASSLAGVAGQEDNAFDYGVFDISGQLGTYGGVVRTVTPNWVANIPATVTAALPAGDIPVAGDFVALGKGNPAGWFAKGRRWPNITIPGQAVFAAGFWGKDRDTYLCIDGCNELTAPLRMGGNAVTDLQKVKPNGPCDGVDAMSSESKSKAGNLVTLDATAATGINGPGEGITLTCQPNTTGGYTWQASASDIPTVDKMRSGLFDGLESHSADLCLGSLFPVSNPPPAPIKEYEVPVKFVVGKHPTTGQSGTVAMFFFDGTQWLGSYMANVDSIKYPANAFFKVYSEVNQKEFCTSGGIDPMQTAPLNGISGSAYMAFSPGGVTYKSVGVFARTVSNNAVNQGLIANKGTRTVTVPKCTITVDSVTGTSTENCVDFTTTINESAAQDRVVDQRIATNPGQTVNWWFSKRGSKCVDADWKLLASCPAVTVGNIAGAPLAE